MSEKNRLQEYCQKNKLPLPVYKTWSNGADHKLQWFASVAIKLNKNDLDLLDSHNNFLIEPSTSTEEPDIIIDTTTPTISKVSAERQVAKKMLDYIKSMNKNNPNKMLAQLSHKGNASKKKKINEDSIKKLREDDTTEEIDLIFTPIEKIYIIDLENKPSFKHKTKSNSLYIGFLSSIHHSIEKYQHWHYCELDNLEEVLEESQNNKLLYVIDGGTADLVDHFMTVFLYPVVNYIQTHNTVTTIKIISGDHAGWYTRACLEKILKWKKIFNIQINNTISIE